MFDLNGYIDRLVRECRAAFGSRLLYAGLQGSYLRGEAREDSDIDVMLVLDGLTAEDMDAYRRILEGIGWFDRSCGFICGRDELAGWTALEICQLRHTTKDVVGKLEDFLPEATRRDEIEYVKMSLGNLYHELCHRYIHADREKNVSRFRGTCKALFFLIQNLHYLESGDFVTTKRELKQAVPPRDREMLELSELPDGFDFDRAFRAAFEWCRDAFVRVGGIS